VLLRVGILEACSCQSQQETARELTGESASFFGRYARDHKTGFAWASVIGLFCMLSLVGKRVGTSMGYMGRPTQAKPFVVIPKRMWNRERGRHPGARTFAQSQGELEAVHSLLQHVNDPANREPFAGFADWNPSARAIDLLQAHAAQLGPATMPSLVELVRANITAADDNQTSVQTWATIHAECAMNSLRAPNQAAADIMAAFDAHGLIDDFQRAVEALKTAPDERDFTIHEQSFIDFWKQPVVRDYGAIHGLIIKRQGLNQLAHGAVDNEIECRLRPAQLALLPGDQAHAAIVADFRNKCRAIPDPGIQRLVIRAAEDVRIAREEYELEAAARADTLSNVPITQQEIDGLVVSDEVSDEEEGDEEESDEEET